ncbi:hypothetical protein BGC07_01565 [Piscirickettsia litoralis]|uniref:Pyrrolidone-carboxylate peptidase n=1 Tax=Piscirickettsia litoralis TaxID=1891921 RepID=A0ABX2ZZ46_9GAMM|nr:hypothetical protein BGC07_01565 [Piscirickettsia litoralis]
MREHGVPSDISDAAGTFCCNHLMYGVLHFCAVNNLPVRAGFIHLPYLPNVAAMPDNLGAPSMSLDVAVKGVKVAIGAALEHSSDIQETVMSRFQI